ncbi:MAG: hypothetical protein AAFQ07_09405 [Chloroflexota bacterium]
MIATIREHGLWSLYGVALLVLVSLPSAYSLAQDVVTFVLSGEEEITAGEAWSLTVQSEGLEVGETVMVTMVHGVTIYSEELVLGSGGVALWDFPENVLTQAGRTQVLIDSGTATGSFSLTINPDDPDTIQAFTTSNSLRAYGEMSTALLSLVSDAHGNPVDDASLVIRSTSPQGETDVGFGRTRDGLAVNTITSMGNPGILRLQVAHGREVVTPLTIVQLAGDGDAIDLDLSAPCLLADGLDNLTMTARVVDSADFPVTDGQVVFFRWGSGGATGITVDGMASVTIPAPRVVGDYEYSVTSGMLTASETITITDGRCDN